MHQQGIREHAVIHVLKIILWLLQPAQFHYLLLKLNHEEQHTSLFNVTVTYNKINIEVFLLLKQLPIVTL